MSGDPRAAFRLLLDPPADGYRNMARDEALLESCAAGESGFPALRLYAFAPACLSIGFSQEHAASVDAAFCRGRGIDVVRRPTGGRAVLHDDEVTYAIVARRGAPPFEGGLLEIYRAVSRGLIAGFERLGIRSEVSAASPSVGSPRTGSICFAEPSRHEITSRGRKIAGSSQARRRGAFLQHGSIPLRLESVLLAGATGAGASGPLPDILGLDPILGRRIAADEVAAALRAGFEGAFGVSLSEGRFTEPEAERAEWLRAHRYLATSWTLRR